MIHIKFLFYFITYFITYFIAALHCISKTLGQRQRRSGCKISPGGSRGRVARVAQQEHPMAGAIQVQQDETACVSWGQDLAGESSIACVAVPSPPHTGSFGAFVRLHPFVGFLRTVLTLVEQTLQLTDYQIRLWPSAEPIPEQLLKGKPGWADATQLLLAAPAVADSVARAGFYMLVVGSSARGREVRCRLMRTPTAHLRCPKVVASSYLLRRVSSSPTSAESLHTMDEPIDYTDGNGKHVQLPLTQVTQRLLLPCASS